MCGTRALSVNVTHSQMISSYSDLLLAMMTLALAEDRRLLRENKKRGHGEWWNRSTERMVSFVVPQVSEILMG